jgi:hypothetical protein
MTEDYHQVAQALGLRPDPNRNPSNGRYASAGVEIWYAARNKPPPEVVKQEVGILFYDGERQAAYRR